MRGRPDATAEHDDAAPTEVVSAYVEAGDGVSVDSNLAGVRHEADQGEKRLAAMLVEKRAAAARVTPDVTAKEAAMEHVKNATRFEKGSQYLFKLRRRFDEAGGDPRKLPDHMRDDILLLDDVLTGAAQAPTDEQKRAARFVFNIAVEDRSTPRGEELRPVREHTEIFGVAPKSLTLATRAKRWVSSLLK